ncbi:AI-2E family transporter [Sandarakinorhabdus sp.]|uniref:AI-2E family transporter n=1 Tax=Sandarakinorhabdus sp. TaxID=1916663 RepID=UPI00286E64C0|nr:AI-2E family transporter [Sandarakinorhabdus sp.]
MTSPANPPEHAPHHVPPHGHGPDDGGRWFRRTLAVMAGIAVAVVIWQLQQLVLVLFASALVGLMLSDFAAFLKRWLRLPFALAIAAAVLIPVVALGLIFGLFGAVMVEQFILLADRFPAALARVEAWVRTLPVGSDLIAQLRGYAPKMEQVVGIVEATLANIGSAITGLIIVLVAALYLAAQPRLYVDGLIAMLPADARGRATETVAAVRAALTSWLKAQAFGMAFVAAATSAGLALVGLPSPLAIGLVAGVCEFVPYLGVVLVSVPTVILGFGQSMETGIFTIIALVVVQQLQGNVVTPLAQSSFGDMPPVLTIFSLIAAGTLLGPLGVVLAVPMTVVGMALLKVRLARLGRSSPLTGG